MSLRVVLRGKYFHQTEKVDQKELHIRQQFVIWHTTEINILTQIQKLKFRRRGQRCLQHVHCPNVLSMLHSQYKHKAV